MTEIHADVLVVGGGAAGIYAALEATRLGATVMLVDKSKVGAGGATVMAQMTVAGALGHAEPDEPALHLADTMASGKGLVDHSLAELLCSDAPRRILETREMGVRWAADGDRLRQVRAPGHSRHRCVYVDVLATGPGTMKGMRAELRRRGIDRNENIVVTELVADGSGRVVGAAAVSSATGESLRIWTPAVVLACGGLTEMYLRNSASVNMTGDALALGLRVGAEALDPEMVQFFPIAHLAPRVIGLDPIMWDPFRYKLGGRLLNGRGEEFVERYAGVADEGTYTATRDVVSYAILKEVEAGRGSPSGGAWLDFRGLPAQQIYDAFPPVVDKLLAQGVDLTEVPVEVAPTAHYTIGGLRVDAAMRTGVHGLIAAGEAVGGAHGANRLSGNAMSEAFVFGAQAGATAAADARVHGVVRPDATATERMSAAVAGAAQLPGRNPSSSVFLPALRKQLQQVMWELVGPFRDAAGLAKAGDELAKLEAAVEAARVGDASAFNLEVVEYYEMRNMLCNADAIRLAASCRTESRGAHQREDFPAENPALAQNSVVTLDDGAMRHRWAELPAVSGPTASTAGAR